MRLALAPRTLYRVSKTVNLYNHDTTHKTKGSRATAIHPVLVAIGGLLPYETVSVLGQ